MGLELRVLGPVEILNGDRRIDVGAAKERLLLVVLGLAAGQVVSVDRLADVLWGGDPPDSAVSSLRVHVSRVRKSLSQSGVGDVLLTRPPGYVLHVDTLDAAAFEHLVARGRDRLAAGDPEEASSSLAEALSQWRGPALADLPVSPFVTAEAARLEEARLGAVEDRLAADLALGRHGAVVSELETLVGTHPLRETLWGHLMLALYRCGRQAEALRAFQSVRAILGDQLGIEPGPALVRLEASILAQDAELDWRPPVPPRPVAPSRPSGVVTFLLTDLENSAALWDARPAAMREALDRHDELIAAAVLNRGGLLIKSRGEGDATMSVFSLASEAVGAAADVARALAGEPWAVPLRVRVSIHTGEALERDGDYFGPTVNRAARLRSLAEGGQVLLTQATAELVTDRLPRDLGMRDLGMHQFRGLARGEQVYELVIGGLAPVLADVLVDTGETTGAAPSRHFQPVPATVPDGVGTGPVRPPLPAPLAAAEGVFCGRRDELEGLRRLWDEATTGARRTVLIAGEPGIGKTRLTAELAAYAYASGATVLYGRCDEDLGVPYQPIVEALRAFALSVDAVTLAAVAARGTAQLARLVPEIGHRLGAVPPTSRGEPEADRFVMFDAVASVLATMSRGAPVLLVLDDLHWAAKPTLLMLSHLLGSAETKSMMIVGTYRDTELTREHPLFGLLADLRRQPDVERMRLDGLDVTAIVELLERSGAHGEASLSLARSVHDETQGNPFFVVEVLRQLRELDAEPDHAPPSRVIAGPADLPEGVREVIRRRLARLSERTHRVLIAAAVVGPTFAVPVLRLVDDAGEPDDLLDAIDEAVAARVVVELPGVGGQYGFAHSLVRQALYGELSAARRARLHRRVGEAIEGLYGEDDRQLPALARHFCEAAAAGQTARAADYGLLAANHALSQFAYEEAAETAERALRALSLDESPDRARRCELALALAHARAGARDLRWKDAATVAAADARALGDGQALAEAAALYTDLNAMATPDPETAPLCEDALNALDPDQLGWRARVLAGLVYYRSLSESRPAATLVVSARQAVDLARESGDPEALGFAVFVNGICLTGTDRVGEQLALADELLALGLSTGDDQTCGRAYRLRAPVRLMAGDLDGFDADRLEIERLGKRLKSWTFLSLAAEWNAVRAMMDGRFAEAEEHFAGVLQHGGHTPNFVNIYAGQTFFLRREQGRLPEIRPLVESVHDINPRLMAFETAVALVDVETGDVEPARARFLRLAEDGFAAVPRDTTLTATLGMLVEVCAQLDDAEHAPELYEILRPFSGMLLVAIFGVYCAGAFDRFLGMLAATAGWSDIAVAHYEAALALEEALGSEPLVARTQLWFGRLLAGRAETRERGRALLGAAAATAGRLGMAALASLASDAEAALDPR